MTRGLTPALDRDWGVSAGDLDWSCRDTAAHIADDLFSYASQVIAQPAAGYLPIEVVLDPTATNEDLLRAVSMCGSLLAQAVRAADPDARGWHPYGTSDPGGFAAMGVVETLVHTHDIARGLGLEWTPPAQLCAPVLARLFPRAPQGDPSEVLLYCTGRTGLGDRPRLQTWSWDSSVHPSVDHPKR
jgi:uncharacterized protein (TIGR03083 family)